MGEKHVVHHRGSPRPDPGWLEQAIPAAGALGLIGYGIWLVVSNIATIVFAVGLTAGIAGGGFCAWTLLDLYRTLTRDRRRLNRAIKRLEAARLAEARIEKEGALLSPEDQAAALAILREQRRKAEEELREALDVIRSGLHSLLAQYGQAREELMSRAGKLGPARLAKKLEKVDAVIRKTEAQVAELDAIMPPRKPEAFSLLSEKVKRQMAELQDAMTRAKSRGNDPQGC